MFSMELFLNALKAAEADAIGLCTGGGKPVAHQLAKGEVPSLLAQSS